MIVRAIATEKAVRLIELDNTLIFEVDRRAQKPEIRKEVEKLFNVKVRNVRTSIKSNKKLAYVQLDRKNPAIDVATKLGMI